MDAHPTWTTGIACCRSDVIEAWGMEGLYSIQAVRLLYQSCWRQYPVAAVWFAPQSFAL